ncbi:hypothetical protein MP228_008547 [Amoeboaphelidium protococcarum]|nr:hypothetical protein MP228_008547 [Amoeboaphelidium protococcarum]
MDFLNADFLPNWMQEPEKVALSPLQSAGLDFLSDEDYLTDNEFDLSSLSKSSTLDSLLSDVSIMGSVSDNINISNGNLADSKSDDPADLVSSSMTSVTSDATATSGSESQNTKRRRLTQDETRVLMSVFMKTQRPSPALKQQLAQQLNLSVRNVQIWFQNKRAKAKRHRNDFILDQSVTQIPQELLQRQGGLKIMSIAPKPQMQLNHQMLYNPYTMYTMPQLYQMPLKQQDGSTTELSDQATLFDINVSQDQEVGEAMIAEEQHVLGVQQKRKLRSVNSTSQPEIMNNKKGRVAM